MKIRKFEGKTRAGAPALRAGVRASYTAIDDTDNDRIIFAIAATYENALIMIDKKKYGGARYDSPGQAMPSSKIIELDKAKKEIIDLIFKTTSIEKVSW